ncbi:MAG: right-handed parallel beta-helix repeat-containing protein [Lentisphaerae bacterium]|nr:right-handed parallel beta-helix repeat-containing protein [Lentisphaerota bacterium]
MRKRLRIGEGKYVGSTHTVLQAAMDALATADGGVLEIPTGTYWMNDSLRLRDRVTVIGERGAILKKVPSRTSKVAHCLGYGHYELAVKEPAKFTSGMGVHLTDNRAGGFYDTVATIVGRKGNFFFIDRMLNHDYSPRQQGRVTSVFPLISICGVREANVRGLTLDGNPDETQMLNGCRGGGVFLLQSHNVQLESLEITNYRGDGISFQQCTNIAIRDCHVHHNKGGGIHPGSGSVRYLLSNNRIEHNGGCGIFYCLRTTHSYCEGNLIEANGSAGISVGERDTDHILRANTIRNNHGAGIEIRKAQVQSGDRLCIEKNQLQNNCKRKGKSEITVLDGIHNLAITTNTIRPAKGKALSVGNRCARVHFWANHVSGRDQRKSDVAGNAAAVRFSKPTCFPHVGLRAATGDKARHLNIISPSTRRRKTFR